MAQEKRLLHMDEDLHIEAYHFKGIMQRFSTHFHEHYVIGIIEKGNRILTVNNKDISIHAHDMVLFNPYDKHACEQIDQETLDFRCINISTDVMKTMMKELTQKEYLPQFNTNLVVKCDQFELIKELHNMIMYDDKEFRKEETFFFLLEQLIQNYSDTVDIIYNKDERIMNICAFIEAHYTEQITLDDISKESKLNKYHLLRTFTKVMGITPYRYVETLRVNEAKRLLKLNYSLRDVAYQTGFSDQSHFSKFFKDFIGVTPKHYQSMVGGKHGK